MTNIASIPTGPHREDRTREHIIFVTDSMGSQGRDKGDGHQKLFQVGSHLLMATGMSDVICATASTMRRAAKSISSPKDLAQEILNYTETLKLAPEDETHFVVGGLENGFPATYVAVTPIIQEGKLMPGKLIRRDLYIDGSGGRFGHPYVRTIMNAGALTTPETLAEGMLVAYDIAKQGSSDAGVNDKLQFGIISPAGTSRIYHPDICLDTEIAEYIAQMTGATFTKENLADTPKAHHLAAQGMKALADIMKMTYRSLEHDLARYSTAATRFTLTAQLWSHNRTDDEHLNLMKEEKLACHAAVAQGAAALVARNLDAIIEYRTAFDQRRREIEQQAMQYRAQ